jgi:hypothetical protein
MLWEKIQSLEADHMALRIKYKYGRAAKMVIEILQETVGGGLVHECPSGLLARSSKVRARLGLSSMALGIEACRVTSLSMAAKREHRVDGWPPRAAD